MYFINIEDNEKKGEKYDDNFIEKKEEINQIVDLINNKFNETQKDIKEDSEVITINFIPHKVL